MKTVGLGSERKGAELVGCCGGKAREARLRQVGRVPQEGRVILEGTGEAEGEMVLPGHWTSFQCYHGNMMTLLSSKQLGKIPALLSGHGQKMSPFIRHWTKGHKCLSPVEFSRVATETPSR